LSFNFTTARTVPYCVYTDAHAQTQGSSDVSAHMVLKT